MPRVNKTSAESPAPDAEGFDVPPAPSDLSSPPPPVIESSGDDEDDVETKPPVVHAIETPEQRRLMREKRIAKAEEEQLRRLMRQFPVVARLVLENQSLKEQLEDGK